MLIRFATKQDIPLWETLSHEYDQYISEIALDFGKWYNGFDDYMNRKIEQNEAVIAVDRRSESCNGAIAFSRSHNRITFFAVSPKTRHTATADKLLTVALRQLNTNTDIIINLPVSDGTPLELDFCYFIENSFGLVKEVNIDGCPMTELVKKADDKRRGGSFHYQYPSFIKAAQSENCPVCNNEPTPTDQSDIEVNDTVWVCGEYPGQGRLFGKMYVMPRKHYFHFEDMPSNEAAAFMNEVQRVGRALRKVTGAVKINYEMHSNSGAHLHIHLFPRFLDDDFPSAPIDYRETEPAPYADYDEYLWFIEQMRKELRNEQ
jgi:diadenosine tetraphosphate (Ap4A) HIT family hydrolase